MPRPKLAEPRYHVVKRKDRRHWAITWTDEHGRTHHRSTPAESRGEAEEFLSKWVEHRAHRGKPTIEWLLDQRLKDLENRGKGTYNPAYFHKVIKRMIGHLQPHELTPARVSRYIKDRAPHRTACARELEEIVAACRLGAENGVIDAVPKIKRPPKSPPRDRFLTRAEARKLLDACRADHLRLFIRLALTTGARRGAILDLTWDRVDLDRGRIDFNDPDKPITKKRRTTTPIDGQLISALRTVKELKRTDYVIEYRGKRVKKLSTGFRLVAARAGMPWCSPHVLKHTAISWLAEAGFSVDQISDMTATDPNTVRRIYRKFSPDYLQGLAKALADNVFDRPHLREVK